MYEYLGFIALSDNTSTGCKSRELQSVPVGPKKGTHLKLRLGSAHKNEMNKFDQVILLTVFRERINILILWISIGCIDCRQRAGRKHEQRERFGINGKIEQ